MYFALTEGVVGHFSIFLRLLVFVVFVCFVFQFHFQYHSISLKIVSFI